MSQKLNIDKSTVTRNLDVLKKQNIVRRIGSTKNGQWEIL